MTTNDRNLMNEPNLINSYEGENICVKNGNAWERHFFFAYLKQPVPPVEFSLNRYLHTVYTYSLHNEN